MKGVDLQISKNQIVGLSGLSGSGKSTLALEICYELKKKGLRVDFDDRNERVGRKIRDAELNKIPYMLIIGESEEKKGTISVRKHGEGDLGSFTVEEFSKIIQNEIDKTLKQF